MASNTDKNLERAKVHMLPTNDRSLVFASPIHDGVLAFDVSLPHSSAWAGYQHLYFTTDEEIKLGDAKVFLYENKVYLSSTSDRFKNFDLTKAKHVISSTDKSLPFNLPQPSQALIKAYCEQGGFDEVDVEYEDANYGALFTLKDGSTETVIAQKLKVDPIHNTITTHRIKDSWNRQEVENKICEAFLGIITHYKENNLELGGFDHNKWIKENL